MNNDKVIRIDGPINFSAIVDALNEIFDAADREYNQSKQKSADFDFLAVPWENNVAQLIADDPFKETESPTTWEPTELDGEDNTDKASLFQWGNTKCAVILKDMAQTYDALMNTNRVTRYVQKGLSELRTLTRVIGDDYDRQLNTTDGNQKPIFREKFLWDYANNNLIYKKFNAPEPFWLVYRSLVKEIINSEKRLQGVMPLRIDGYTNEDVIAWEKSEKVKIARSKFKTVLKRYLADYKPFHNN